MRGDSTQRWAVGALVVAVGAGAAGACGGDDDGAAGPTLPPIATTSTLAPATTQNILDQDRFVVVQQGDILSEIAKRYAVSQDALMAVNGITDPDAVSVGQLLELPLDAVLPTTVAPPTTPSLAVTTVAP